MKTLVEQAKEITKPNRKYPSGNISQEDIDLAIAYAKREITGSQLCAVWEIKQNGQHVNKVLACLKEYFRRQV